MLLCVSLSIKMLKIGGWIFKFFSSNLSFVFLHLQYLKVLIPIDISVCCLPPRSHFQAHLWWSCTRAFKRELSLLSDLRLGTKFLFSLWYWWVLRGIFCILLVYPDHLFIYTADSCVFLFLFHMHPPPCAVQAKGMMMSAVVFQGSGFVLQLDEQVPLFQHLGRFGLGFLWAQGGICCSYVLWGDRRWMGALHEGKSPPMSCSPVSRRALRPQLSKLSQGMPVSQALMSSDFFMPLIFFPLSLLIDICLFWAVFACTALVGSPEQCSIFMSAGLRVRNITHSHWFMPQRLQIVSSVISAQLCSMTQVPGAMLHSQTSILSQARESSSRASIKSWAGRVISYSWGNNGVCNVHAKARIP